MSILNYVPDMRIVNLVCAKNTYIDSWAQVVLRTVESDEYKKNPQSADISELKILAGTDIYLLNVISIHILSKFCDSLPASYNRMCFDGYEYSLCCFFRAYFILLQCYFIIPVLISVG